MFGKGYIPDAPHRLHWSLWNAHKELGIWASAAPLKMQLHVPAILDQGQTGSCTGHATAQAIWTKLGGQLPSPIGIYAGARMVERAPDTSAPLEDNGAEPAQVMLALDKFGACPASIWGNYPANPATINAEPTLMQLEASSAFEYKGAYNILSSGSQRASDMIDVLAAGNPICVATPTGNTLQLYSGGVIGTPDGPIDHYVCVVGYEYDGSSPLSAVFTVANSWGASWGEAGFFRANVNWVVSLADLYVMNVVQR